MYFFCKNMHFPLDNQKNAFNLIKCKRKTVGWTVSIPYLPFFIHCRRTFRETSFSFHSDLHGHLPLYGAGKTVEQPDNACRASSGKSPSMGRKHWDGSTCES